MRRPTHVVTALLCFVSMMAMTDRLAGREPGTMEIEDVSDTEKIQWARATKVIITDAIRNATAEVPGKVIEAALHAINGRLLYEIEIVTADGKIAEVFIDPQSGKLIHPGDTK
jgi:uncharacterized membrane protein YkoI